MGSLSYVPFRFSGTYSHDRSCWVLTDSANGAEVGEVSFEQLDSLLGLRVSA